MATALGLGGCGVVLGVDGLHGAPAGEDSGTAAMEAGRGSSPIADASSQDGQPLEPMPGPDAGLSPEAGAPANDAGDATAPSNDGGSDASVGAQAPFVAQYTFGSALAPVQLHDANGGCLDLPSGITANGSDVQIWDCDADGLNQLWYMDSGGAIHYGANPDKCLDLPNDDPADHARIQVMDCNHGATDEQQWVYGADGTLRKLTGGVAGKCIELLDGDPQSGNIVQLYACNDTSGQTWFPLLGTQAGPMQLHDGNGGCLGVPGGTATNGVLLDIESCAAAGAGQLWFMDSRGAIHFAATPTKCLDLPNASQTDHARLQILDCDNGSSQDQQWVSEPDRTLRKFSNGVAGLCVELLNGSPDAGNVVQLFDCNGTPGQTWFGGML
ncbi:MAG TPA: RICIN domain-containing protein [Polyangiaceae bacterium]